VFPAFWTWWDSEAGDEEAEERIPSALFKTADRTSRLAACYLRESQTGISDITIG